MRKPPGSSLPSAISSSTAAVSFRRQPNTPARSAAVSSFARSRTRRASSRRASSRDGSRLRDLPLPRHQVVSQRAPRAALVDEVRAREDETVVERRDPAVDLLLLEAGRGAQLRSRQRAERGDCLDDGVVLGGLAVRGDEQRHEPGRDTRHRAGEMLADTGKASSGQLVLRPPEEVDLVGVPVHFPACRDLLPQRREHDVGLRKEHRKADLVDPARRLRHRPYHPH